MSLRTRLSRADITQPHLLLDAHLNALRAVPRFRRCRFRLIVECCLEQGSYVCDQALAKHNDVEIVCSTNHTYGIFTTPGNKPGYFVRLRKVLDRDSLSFYETVVAACPFQASMSREQLSRANMLKLEQQFSSFRYVYLRPSLASRGRATMTGHADHENHYTARQQDDIVMGIAFGIKFALDTLADPPFVTVRTRLNRLL